MLIFFKSTLRSLWKNKAYSFLNIAGLAIGITCAALIFLWVEDEVNYDNTYQKKDELYLVEINADVDAGVFTHSSTPGPLAPSILSEVPGVANTCRMSEGSTSLLFTNGDKTLYASGRYADPSVFDMFAFPFQEGSASNAFSQLHSVVITERTARNVFGDTKNIVGKSIRIDNKQDYIVSGVLKNMPENSSLQFDWLIPYEVYREDNGWLDKWGNFGINTYVALKTGVHVADVNKQLHDFIAKKQGAQTSTSHAFLFNMNEWHLYDDFKNGKQTGDGRILYVRLFSIIAWIILIVACINFMNLATARSEKRAKEVGVRKVLGSGKQRLIMQFIGEALFMSLLATLVALLLISMVLPLFNTLVQKNLSIQLANPAHLFSLIAITILCGLIAGSYPSFYLSSFNPIAVLKGVKLKNSSAAAIRKGLVITQFVVSIVLIIGTVVVYQQIQYVKQRNIGYDKNNLLQVELRGNMLEQFNSIKQDLINTGTVQNATLADHETITSGNNTTGLTWPGKAPNSIIVISQRLVSKEFISTVGMQVLRGRDFEPTDLFEFNEQHTPKVPANGFNVVVTESMEKLLGKGSAIGKSIFWSEERGGYKLTVVGVVKDYVYGDMYGQSSPVIFYNSTQPATLLYIRTKHNSDIEATLNKIGSVIKQHVPDYPFEYKFVDDQFNNLFLNETLIGKLSRIFAILAIVISCLGLFGLAAYTAERRTKEISIRKVLGAQVSGIVVLLSKDFLLLVIIACIVAFPVAWWTMHNWLQSYQYRVQLSWWVFAAAAVAAILIALLTVSFQAIKTALTNPVKSLRNE
ncbi:MAG: ABC transporter permease [Filimonas sp.]|nr:ABC transporter permease [Filimonas sp.]